jgi:tRNA nucleotidyltransferase/poly(A) polymerase
MDMYEVGGCVRDEILGKDSKDIDFSVVLEEGDLAPRRTKKGTFVTDPPFVIMRDELRRRGFKIFLETPQHLTIRAQFPKMAALPLVGRERQNLTADFVLARKEGDYSDGRRPDSVEPGTLWDDLARRDFTMNAIAKDADGNLIDPFNGVRDIEARIIRAVGSAHDRLMEDALRAVRALRFSVTKGFHIERNLRWEMQNAGVLDRIVNNISDERIEQELSKMFRFDTLASLSALGDFPALTRAMFAGKVSLDSTLKTKGRGR